MLRGANQVKNKIASIIPQKSWLADGILLGALAIFGIYLIRGIFAPGFLYNYDLSQHFTESVYVATVLLPQYHQLVGWNPYFYLGWPQGQFNPPASYLIYSILYYTLSGFFSSLSIFKIMLAIFFILPALAVYFAAKLFGLGRISAFFSGFIAIGTAGGFELGGPLDAMYYGMYEFTVAVALVPLIIAVYHQSFQRKSWGYFLIAAGLVAFDFMLHTLAGLFAVVALIVYTAVLFLKSFIERSHFQNPLLPKTILKFALILVIVLGICSFWIIPAYESKSFYVSQGSLVDELGNFATTYNDLHLGYIFGEEATPLVTNFLHVTQPKLDTMEYSAAQAILSSSSPMFYQLLMVLAALGGVLMFLRTKSRFAATVIFSIIGLFLYVSLGPKYYEPLWHLQMFQLFDLRPARAAAVARIFLATLAGAGIGESFFILNKLSERLGKKSYSTRLGLKVLSIAVLVFLGLTLAVNSYELMSQLPIASTTRNLPQGGDVSQLFSWISQNVPNNTRVAYEEFLTPDQHLLAASPVKTGHAEVGSGYEFWWSGADTSSTLETVLKNGYLVSWDGQEVYQTLVGLNTGYVVVWGTQSSVTEKALADSTKLQITTNENSLYEYQLMASQTPESLADYPTYFQLAKQIGPFYVYKLENYTSSYVSIINGTGSANVTSFEPENIVVHVNDASAGSRLLVRVSYFTNWAASSSQGIRLSISPINVTLPLDSVEYMAISLPKGGSYNVTLNYGSTSSDVTGDAISWVSLFGVLLGILLIGKRPKSKIRVPELGL